MILGAEYEKDMKTINEGNMAKLMLMHKELEDYLEQSFTTLQSI